MIFLQDFLRRCLSSAGGDGLDKSIMATGGPLTVRPLYSNYPLCVKFHYRFCSYITFVRHFKLRAVAQAAEIEDERALVDSYGMLGKGIQEAIEIHNSRLGQMRRAVIFAHKRFHCCTPRRPPSSFIIHHVIPSTNRCKPTRTQLSNSRMKSRTLSVNSD